MPETSNFDESCMVEACEAAQAKEKPNIALIAREYGVPRRTLRNRVRKGSQPCTARKPVNKALDRYQEEALICWIAFMRDINMPVMPRILEEWANRALKCAGHLKLGPVKQETKESKYIQAEDAGLLAHWYNQLANVVKDTPAWLVYNFDGCGFQPGEGTPDLAESEKDSWVIDLFFIFKGGGIFMESWFNKTGF
ncbi:hypothetical protein AN8159.2 [Aspergillus nidulans FGSC A4]|uniref:HTH psq-type domain-containing protein n=1 Tax=Emericella nidulans (strain FGSC A4 / ATCC 38163 / CBS 112.46 / NRRL 194 / M139) TaxID=227321 RepID=Q5AU71_EMENI|nr:hypothetical protein [Aspergillus nidulans FGSC A4]EAA59181.1 hypothetical protein AN8159.2 [Aspergillus nidulans FGSC A4]CBF74004.1 TPA: conserved hypothetical protein [Aspergillus nidulans FGSC A4]|eukprot:XP_681428.1 hypothetical protein AN8159.2 [Aspergillus nidulans FGSC A4]